MYSRKTALLERAYEFLNEAPAPVAGTPAFSAQAASRANANVKAQPTIAAPKAAGGVNIPPTPTPAAPPPPKGRDISSAQSLAASREFGAMRR